MIQTIAIDLDSVLADVMIIWIDEYNNINKTNIKKSDIIKWDIHKILPISKEKCTNLFTNVWARRWEEIPLTKKNNPKVIEDIKRKGYRISIITKRARSTVPFVSFWLDLNKIIYDEIIFIFDDQPKMKYPFDILVDDSPDNLKNIHHPKKGIIYDQPWNRNFCGNRINSLHEIIKILDH